MEYYISESEKINGAINDALTLGINMAIEKQK